MVHNFSYYWQDKNYNVAYEILGQGEPVLLLPAFSTVSSRQEMNQVAIQLADFYQVYSLDWLGFGESDRPKLDYCPEIYLKLLKDFVSKTFTTAVVVVAAGHAAPYALRLDNLISSVILVAPTWQGPLRVMGLPEQIRSLIRNTVRSEGLGEFLYSLNTNAAFLKYMYSSHVYLDKDKLTDQFIENKHTLTQHPNGRFAPAAFVTGKLDLFEDRSEFLSNLSSITVPVLVIIAENAPTKSKAEMEACVSLPNIAISRLKGTLGIHEENPLAVSKEILKFLKS